jgi:two-component system, OmpR family, response regulator
MRVLLVEDEPILGQAVRDQSVADGHSVDWVRGVVDAEAAILSAPFELLLLDLMLPDGRGLDSRRDGSRATRRR